MSWWWSLTHGRAEDDSGDTLPQHRLGPYDTREEAEGALEAARRRTEEQDARDALEDDWGRR